MNTQANLPKPLCVSEHRRPIRPLKALKHFRKLIADKEDTTQVFYVVEALSGSSLIKSYNEFVSSDAGLKRFKERRYLPPLLDDHAALKAMPAGSFGRAYVEFMQREGLSAQGLVDEHDRFNSDFGKEVNEDLRWYVNRRRDTHDLLHILTGYGRDALGEASILGFTHSQHSDPGIIFIAYMAAIEIRKSAPKGAPIFRTIREGQNLGRAAKMIIKEDIYSYLPLPLDEARKRLNVGRPETYFKTHEMMHAHGIDPYGVIGANAA